MKNFYKNLLAVSILLVLFPVWQKIKIKKNFNFLNKKVIDFTARKPLVSENEKRHNTWVTSFARGDKFLVNQNVLSLQASRYGFKKIINYDENDIKELKAKYPNIFKYQRGYGLWLWKPYIILKTLEQMKKGEYLIYLDAGSFINSDLREIFAIFDNGDIDIIVSEQDWCGSVKNLGGYTGVNRPLLCTNGNFTKKSFLRAMNLDNNSYKNKFQIGANLMILRNTDYTKKIIQKWLDLCSREEYIKPCLAKEQNNKSQMHCSEFDKSNEDFMIHLEDQAILSAVLYKEQKFEFGKKKIKEISVSEYVDYRYDGFKSKKSSFIAHVRSEEDSLMYIIDSK